ncbi:MAG: folate-binding protein, partial [Actinobacteria bacterium]|nr:folate-binding protein [Actinomycetota bacterium]
PHEYGLIGSAVHLHKGCYRGQEAVARTINLGRPPRRLVLLHLDGAEDQLPAPGSDVRIPGSDGIVGRVGSAIQHFEQGPLALATVKRATDLNSDLEILAPAGAVRASQVLVVVIN